MRTPAVSGEVVTCGKGGERGDWRGAPPASVAPRRARTDDALQPRHTPLPLDLWMVCFHGEHVAGRATTCSRACPHREGRWRSVWVASATRAGGHWLAPWAQSRHIPRRHTRRRRVGGWGRATAPRERANAARCPACARHPPAPPHRLPPLTVFTVAGGGGEGGGQGRRARRPFPALLPSRRAAESSAMLMPPPSAPRSPPLPAFPSPRGSAVEPPPPTSTRPLQTRWRIYDMLLVQVRGRCLPLRRLGASKWRQTYVPVREARDGH